MKTAKEFLDVARSLLGKNEDDGSFGSILDTYNSHRPLAVGYAVKPMDDWCDVFVSVVGILSGMVDLIGTECGCERHIAIWKAKGIWHPGSITPQPGDIFALDWNSNHSGMADHVGIVEYVEGGVIHTIEGNRGGAVRRKEYPVGDSRFKGFARPAFAEIVPDKSVEDIAREVIAGKWGSGEDRRQRLLDAGYDYDAVQAEVNNLMGTPHSETAPEEPPEEETPKLTVDGVWGRDTSLALQGKLGAKYRDGIISNQYQHVYDKYILSNCIHPGGWGFVNYLSTTGSDTMYRLQQLVGAPADGVLGPATIKKLQAYLGVTVDGIMGRGTVTALQNWLNS